jgi:hypothetical protein
MCLPAALRWLLVVAKRVNQQAVPGEPGAHDRPLGAGKGSRPASTPQDFQDARAKRVGGLGLTSYVLFRDRHWI